MAQKLLTLSDLISTAVQQIDTVCRMQNTTFPSLDEPFDPKSEEIRGNPQILQAAAVLVAAAEQLIATTWPSPAILVHAALGFHVSSAIRVATACNVTEALAAVGPSGMHVDDICKKMPIPAHKLGRVMRLLATRHIFREVKPDVFCNNRISSLLGTGKPVEELQSHPEKKHENTGGLIALMEHFTDEQFKASAHLADVLTDPATAASDAPNETSFNLAFKTNADFWTWLDLPENKSYLERFSIAMSSTRQLMPEAAILDGFDWAGLPKSATVIDVGGGVGAVSLELAKAYPNMRLVIQDREKTIKEASKFWDESMPGAVSSGRVTLEVHDFFTEQARTAPDVFLMRMIVHDWANPYAQKILEQLHKAAGPATKLVVVENIVQYACENKDAPVNNIPGAQVMPAPEPLLSNMGMVNVTAYLADIQILNCVNGQERTLTEFDTLLRTAGWKIERVHSTPGVLLSQIVAVPV